MGIILAGGSGERFWPVSRPTRPKQLLRLANEDTCLLEDAVRGISPLIRAEDLYIVTSRPLHAAIRQAQVGVPDQNVLAEPASRNTAGCLLYALAVLLSRPGTDRQRLTLAALTADHAIRDEEAFRAAASAAMDTAEREGALVCIGLRPTRAETGFGYIEVPLDATQAPGVSRVVRFHEKPSREEAEAYVASGRFLWNSGMLFCTASTLLAELETASPELAQVADAVLEAAHRDDATAVDSAFARMQSISIDHALLERTSNLKVVAADLGWDNLNAWDVLSHTRPADENGNIAVGGPVLVDCRDCIAYNEPGAEAMTVAGLGLQGLAIIVTSDAVLVMPKSRAQEVRRVVQAVQRKEHVPSDPLSGAQPGGRESERAE